VLKVRQQQADALAAVRQASFEDRMVAHLDRCVPEVTGPVGEAGTRDLIRYGVGRARAHGFVTELQLCRYIDLMCFFGVDFDRELRWAQSTLARDDSPDPEVRMRRLQAAARAELRALDAARGR
jgi:hypothetical protein